MDDFDTTQAAHLRNIRKHHLSLICMRPRGHPYKWKAQRLHKHMTGALNAMIKERAHDHQKS